MKAANGTTPYIKWRTFLVEASLMISPAAAAAAAADNSEGGPKEGGPVMVASVMQILIEVMADRSEGVANNLSDEDFIQLLKMVCKKKKVDSKQVKEAEEYLRHIGKRQSGVLTYENLKHHECPSLQ